MKWYDGIMRSVFFRWLLVLVWAALIWLLSGIPSLASGFSPLWDTVLRKIAHASEFGVLTLLLSRASRQSTPRGIWPAVIVSAAYAGLDEYHQTFVSGRHGSPADVVIDGFGIAIAALLVLRKKDRRTGL